MASKLFVLRFKFDDFENLPHAPGDETLSYMVTDENGLNWPLSLYPGGRENDGNADGDQMISLYYLWDGGVGRDAYARITFIVRDAQGKAYDSTRLKIVNISGIIGQSDGFGDINILKRSDILNKSNNILLDGALAVDVEIQIVTTDESFFEPVSPLSKNMLKLLQDDDDTDVSFKLGDTLISAHKLILKVNAPILYDFCQKNGKDIPLTIKNIDPEVFRLMLRYVYAGEATEAIELLRLGAGEVRINMGKELIEAADQFGVVGLKMIVETVFVENLVINTGNVVDWLFFADAKNCPLLKEYALNYSIVMVKDVFKSEASGKLQQSPKLMTELILAMSEKLNVSYNIDETSKMTVNELRAKLSEKGLEVDGSKETLVSRLKVSNEKKEN